MAHKIRHVKDGLLAIGFDGSAALLGHANHFDLTNRLRGDRPEEQLAALVCDRISAVDSAPKRADMLREWTAQMQGKQLDRAAIQVIGGLVQSRHVTAIVTSDPTDQLYVELRNFGVNLTMIQAASAAPEDFRAYTNYNNVDPVYVNAGGLLLAGYQKGVGINPDKTEMENLKNNLRHLRTFFRKYSSIYCWGWCPPNIRYNYFDDDDPGARRQQIYRLGRYTEIEELFGNYDMFQVFDPDEPQTGVATTEVIKSVGEALSSYLGVITQNSRPARPVKPSALGVDTRARPLLRAEVLEGLLVDNDDNERRVMVIGVEDTTIRQSVATWFYVKTAGRADCVMREDGSFRDLATALTTHTRRRNLQHVIGCYLDSVREPEPAWQDSIITYLNQWSVLPDGYPPHRVTLFCPPPVVAWLNDNLGDDRNGIWLETHEASTYLREENLQEWITAVLDDVDARPAEKTVSAMTDIVVQQAAEARGNGNLAALVHRLEVWRQRIIDAVAGSAQESNGASPIDPVLEWRNLEQSLQHLPAVIDTDYQIKPRRVEDFELGPFTRHPPSDDEGDQGDEDDE